MSSIISEIRDARIGLLTDEQKQGILTYVKKCLTRNDYAIISGAKHYCDQIWVGSAEVGFNRAPYSMHPAIAEWLHTLGFCTSRYYNKGGVDNGLKIWIN